MWCPSPLVLLHVIFLLRLVFSCNEAACIHPYRCANLLVTLCSQLSQTSTLRQPSTHPCMRFPSGMHPKPSPTKQWAFPHTFISEDLNSSPASQQTAEVPRKLCATPELQLATTLTWVNTTSYHFHGSLVSESGILAVTIIHKASWSCTDKVFFLFVRYVECLNTENISCMNLFLCGQNRSMEVRPFSNVTSMKNCTGQQSAVDSLTLVYWNTGHYFLNLSDVTHLSLTTCLNTNFLIDVIHISPVYASGKYLKKEKSPITKRLKDFLSKTLQHIL